MKNSLAVSANERRNFNTLAQSRTELSGNIIPIGAIVKGNGTELSNKARLQTWAKKKLISSIMMGQLADIATANGETQRAKSYWNTYYCFRRIKSFENGLYGEYCKN